jgi:hypothetical protein
MAFMNLTFQNKHAHISIMETLKAMWPSLSSGMCMVFLVWGLSQAGEIKLLSDWLELTLLVISGGLLYTAILILFFRKRIFSLKNEILHIVRPGAKNVEDGTVTPI